MSEPRSGSWPWGGWEWLEQQRGLGWIPVPAWGSDGWDLGEWALVVISIRNGCDCGPLERLQHRLARFQVAEYVEGDLRCWTFDTIAARNSEIDRLAEAWWRQLGNGPDLAGVAEGRLPSELLGPYRR